MSELELAGVGNITGIHRALRAKLSHNNATGDSSSADLRAGDFEAINQSGTVLSPVGQMTGVQGRVDNQANANLTKARAVAGQIANGSGANIGTAAAFEVLNPVNSGAINTLIGLEIPDITQGTDNYAIRTGAGRVKLGDVIELAQQSSSPAAKPELMQIYPKTDGKLYAKNPAGTEYELSGIYNKYPISLPLDLSIASNEQMILAALTIPTGKTVNVLSNGILKVG